MIELPRHVPKGLALEVVLLKEKNGEEKFHDRFILTDRWGVQFSVGLDSHGPNETTNTIVTLLTEDLWARIYRKYVSEHPAFERVGDPIRILGIA
jgi:hypothetical protein